MMNIRRLMAEAKKDCIMYGKVCDGGANLKNQQSIIITAEEVSLFAMNGEITQCSETGHI